MINSLQQQQTHHNSSICQNCFIQLNNLDQHQMIADKIKFDLLNSYNHFHRLHDDDDVKVKIETMDIPMPEMIYNDENDEDDEEEMDDEEYLVDSEKLNVVPVDIIFKKSPEKKTQSKKKRGPKKQAPMDEKIITHVINGQVHYQCRDPSCNRTMVKLSQMKQHVLIHTSERNICCQECGMMFKTQSCLYSHRKIHMERDRMIW